MLHVFSEKYVIFAEDKLHSAIWKQTFIALICKIFSQREFFSKITPSLFTIKEGSTSHPDPLTLREEGGNRSSSSLGTATL